jgi:signal transduction histidine kinase
MAIKGLSEIIRDSKNVNLTTLRRWADLIHKEAFNLDFLLANIFAAADIEAGEAIPQSSPLNIVELIRHHIALLKQKSDERNVQIEYMGENTVHFNTDSHMLKRIIMNLLFDTVETCPAEKKICVTAEVLNQKLCLVIQYDAPELHHTTLNPVYDRLRHLNPALENSAGNCGLSLSVVKELIDKLGGSLTIESEISMSRITVQLPELPTVPFLGSDIIFGQDETL